MGQVPTLLLSALSINARRKPPPISSWPSMRTWPSGAGRPPRQARGSGVADTVWASWTVSAGSGNGQCGARSTPTSPSAPASPTFPATTPSRRLTPSWNASGWSRYFGRRSTRAAPPTGLDRCLSTRLRAGGQRPGGLRSPGQAPGLGRHPHPAGCVHPHRRGNRNDHAVGGAGVGRGAGLSGRLAPETSGRPLRRRWRST